MNSSPALGRIVKVPLRTVWTHEAHGFTPWLAQAENIALLAATLDLGEVEVEATEKAVGRFSLDILARDETGHPVLIENQIEATDHRHLGQILTYLAGLEGEATVIWIARDFLEEHRAAIDWLNANTTERFQFFGVEIELLKIGQSEPAPNFKVVAKPNDWSRDVKATARQLEASSSAGRFPIRIAYWQSFGEFLRSRRSAFQIRRVNKDHWFSFSIGRTGFAIAATISADKQRVGVELYVDKDPGKAIFNTFLSERSKIEAEFGETLEWQELPTKKGCRIVIYKSPCDPAEAGQYPELHAWMLDHMERFKKVFAGRIRALPKNDVVADDEEE